MNVGLIIFIIAQVLGIISWLLLIYSYTKEDIDKLLFIQILVCILDFASYLLLGADAGIYICLIELFKTILYYKSDKDKLIFNISMICYLFVGLLTFKQWYALLPVLASIVDSFGLSKNSKVANACSIVSNILWTIYDFLILSFVGAFNDIVVAICNVIILFRGYKVLMKISKFRINKANNITFKDIDRIFKLDEKNLGKDNTWNKDYQMSVYKKNKDSFYIIRYKNKMVGYINYLNLIPDEFEKLKRIRKYPDYLDESTIIPYKTNKKTYILIETINLKKEFEKIETIELINKKIKEFIKTKRRQRIYIHGIMGIAITDFEKEAYEKMIFKLVKKYKDNIYLYELPYEIIYKI